MSPALLALVLAFSAPSKFRDPVEIGGGAGLRFSGSPSAKYDCSVCHQGPRVPLELESVGDQPVSGFAAGKTYEFELRLDDGLAAGVSLEVSAGALSNVAALPATLRCGGKDPLEVQAEVRTAIAGKCADAPISRWRFAWTIAERTTEPTLWASAVAADADGRSIGDRYATLATLVGGGPLPTAPACDASGALAPALALLVLLRRRLHPERVKRVEGPVVALLVLLFAPAARAESAEVRAGAGVGGGTLVFASALPHSYQGVDSPAHPTAGFAVALYPFRLEQVDVLPGLYASAAYQRGYVLGGLALGLGLERTSSLPFRADFALGYRLDFGAFSIAPCASYLVFGAGLEQNARLQDGVWQAIGGALPISARVGKSEVRLELSYAVVRDAGQSAIAYGAVRSGTAIGAALSGRYHLGKSGFHLFAEVRTLGASVQFSGGGTRLDGFAEIFQRGTSATIGAGYGF